MAYTWFQRSWAYGSAFVLLGILFVLGWAIPPAFMPSSPPPTAVELPTNPSLILWRLGNLVMILTGFTLWLAKRWRIWCPTPETSQP